MEKITNKDEEALRLIAEANAEGESFDAKQLSDELRNDRDAVLEALKLSGYALQYASTELRGDKEVVLAAVNNYSGALQYASNELKDIHEALDKI